MARGSFRLVRCFISVFFLLAGGLASGQKASNEKVILIFEGNKILSEQELLKVTNECLVANPHPKNEYSSEVLDHCLGKTRRFLFSKGYLQGTVGEPKISENGLRVVVPITEGALYRLGEVEINGSKLLAPTQIRELMDLKTGDIANPESLNQGLYEPVKKVYDKFGYVQYTAEIDPAYHLNAGGEEGTVDFKLTIDEGPVFTVRTINFKGNENVSEDELRTGMLVQAGDVFNKELFDESLKSISQTAQFEVIDKDKDVDYRTDNEVSRLDITIHLRKKPPALQ